MNGIIGLLALFVVFGAGLALIAFVAYRRVLRRAKGIERGLKMVPLLIHLPPPSEDTEGGSRPQQEVMREKITQAQVLYELIAGTAQAGFKSTFYGQRHIAFEIVASNGLVHYFAAVPIGLVGVVEQAIVTTYPGARVEEVEDHNIFNPQGRLTATVGGELILRHEAAYPIATIATMEKDPMEAMINSLYKLQLGDGAAIQIMLRPARANWTKRSLKLVSKKRNGRASGIGFGVTDLAKATVKSPEARREEGSKEEPSKLEEQMLQAIEEKTKHPGYEVLVRILASSPSYDRSQILLRNLVTAFALFEAPGSNGFQFIEGRDIQGLVTAFIFRFFPPELASTILNSVELATLFHLPDAQFTATNQVERQQSKQVDGPVNMPTAGLLMGYNFYRGVKKEIRLSPEDRRRHAYIVGQTGTGKSTMLENLAVQDMLAGNGFAFIDPHGDTAEKLLSMVPKERAEDVIYFNPADMDHPLGLNIFEYSSPEQKDFLIQESINMLYKLYDPGKTGIIGPRFEHWYRNAALTLMADPHGASFIELPKVFTDSGYLKNKFKYLKDPTVIDFWTKEMGQTSDYHKSEMLGWFVSKFGAFQSNEMMRNIIGQTQSSFNIRDIMDNKKILIVNLSKGRVGELNSQLLGMIFVIKIQAAAMSRANIPEDQRSDFCLYVDEFQNFSTDSFAAILSEARKYRLNLIVANQFIGQLTDEIRDAVFGNIGSILSYRTGPEDAEFLVKQFQPIFDQRDLVNLPNHNAVMKLLVGGLPSQPFSITALPPLGIAHPELGLAIQQLSAAKYGVPRGVAEADIFARLQNQPATVVPNAATAALTPPPLTATPAVPASAAPAAAPVASVVPAVPTPAPPLPPVPPLPPIAPAPVSAPITAVALPIAPVPLATVPAPAPVAASVAPAVPPAPPAPQAPATPPPVSLAPAPATLTPPPPVAPDHSALLPAQSIRSAVPAASATPVASAAAPPLATPASSSAPTKTPVDGLSINQLRQATPSPPPPPPPSGSSGIASGGGGIADIVKSPPRPPAPDPVAPPTAPAAPPPPITPSAAPPMPATPAPMPPSPAATPPATPLAPSSPVVPVVPPASVPPAVSAPPALSTPVPPPAPQSVMPALAVAPPSPPPAPTATPVSRPAAPLLVSGAPVLIEARETDGHSAPVKTGPLRIEAHETDGRRDGDSKPPAAAPVPSSKPTPPPPVPQPKPAPAPVPPAPRPVPVPQTQPPKVAPTPPKPQLPPPPQPQPKPALTPPPAPTVAPAASVSPKSPQQPAPVKPPIPKPAPVVAITPPPPAPKPQPPKVAPKPVAPTSAPTATAPVAPAPAPASLPVAAVPSTPPVVPPATPGAPVGTPKPPLPLVPVSSAPTPPPVLPKAPQSPQPPSQPSPVQPPPSAPLAKPKPPVPAATPVAPRPAPEAKPPTQPAPKPKPAPAALPKPQPPYEKPAVNLDEAFEVPSIPPELAGIISLSPTAPGIPHATAPETTKPALPAIPTPKAAPPAVSPQLPSTPKPVASPPASLIKPVGGQTKAVAPTVHTSQPEAKLAPFQPKPTLPVASPLPTPPPTPKLAPRPVQPPQPPKEIAKPKSAIQPEPELGLSPELIESILKDPMSGAHIELHHQHRTSEDPGSVAAQKSLAGQTTPTAPNQKAPAATSTDKAQVNPYVEAAAPKPVLPKPLPKEFEDIPLDTPPPPLPGQIVAPITANQPPAPQPPAPATAFPVLSDLSQPPASAEPLPPQPSPPQPVSPVTSGPVAPPVPKPQPKPQPKPAPKPQPPKETPKPQPKPQTQPQPKPAAPPPPQSGPKPPAIPVELPDLSTPPPTPVLIQPDKSSQAAIDSSASPTPLPELILPQTPSAAPVDTTKESAPVDRPDLKPGEIFIDASGNVVQG